MKKTEREARNYLFHKFSAIYNMKIKFMSFYFYHNTTGNKHLKIHNNECSYCVNGTYKPRKNQKMGKYGVWTGAFDEIEDAITYIKNNVKTSNPIEYCKRCKPNLQ